MAQALDIDIFTVTWRIVNFSMCPYKKGEWISSPDFVVDALGKTTWHLELYPKGNDSSDGEDVSVFLHRSNQEEPDKVTVEFHIVLITSDMKSVDIKNLTPIAIEKGTSLGFRKFVTITELSEHKDIYTPNDVFTLMCCMRRGTELSAIIPPKKVFPRLRTNTYSMEEICSVISDVNTSKKVCSEDFVFTTLIPVERRQITWVINDFQFQMQLVGKTHVNSISVLSNLREKSELLLSCYVNRDCYSGDSVLINIQRKDKNFPQMWMRCTLFILNKNNVVEDSKEADHLFQNYHEIWSFPSVVNLRTLKNFRSEILDGDALKLKLEFLMSYIGEEVTTGQSSLQTSKSDCTDDLKQDLCDLLIYQEGENVTLISEEEEIRVHKSVICARSPVFKAMFTNETEEKRTGVVHITDVDADTLKNMKEFMYNDEFPELSVEDTMKLYMAADKYEFYKLKRECASMIMYSLSLSNICKILLLADKYQDFRLMVSVRRFLICRSKEVFQSDGWDEFMKDNLRLSASIMCNILRTCDIRMN